ncbi:hypothetical protein CSC18_3864 [Klebsiella aerogenes]|nr:hypothetical protein CSC18_3864 [Klebsiella aerogenes]
MWIFCQKPASLSVIVCVFIGFTLRDREKQAIFLRRGGVEGQSRTQRANNP